MWWQEDRGFFAHGRGLPSDYDLGWHRNQLSRSGEKSRRDTGEQLRETCGLCAVLDGHGRETAALHGSRVFSKCSKVLRKGFCYREDSACLGSPARCSCLLSRGWEDIV